MASLDQKLDRRRCRRSRDAERCVDCGCRGTGGWRDVDGRRRYVSVSSQSDTEQANLARERKELSENPGFELDELADIYVSVVLIRTLCGSRSVACLSRLMR